MTIIYGFDPEQGPEIDRVRSRIAPLVIAFWRAHIDREFFVEELRRFITDAKIAAPASPDRILRDLRQRGVINYIVISRSRSLYRGLPLNKP